MTSAKKACRVLHLASQAARRGDVSRVHSLLERYPAWRDGGAAAAQVDHVMAIAKVLVEHGAHALAVELLSPIDPVKAEDAYAQWMSAALLGLGEPERAEAVLRRRTTQPGFHLSPGAHYHLARLLAKRGARDDALRELRLALSMAGRPLAKAARGEADFSALGSDASFTEMLDAYAPPAGRPASVVLPEASAYIADTGPHRVSPDPSAVFASSPAPPVLFALSLHALHSEWDGWAPLVLADFDLPSLRMETAPSGKCAVPNDTSDLVDDLDTPPPGHLEVRPGHDRDADMRLGGSPRWLQQDATPTASGRNMVFLGQASLFRWGPDVVAYLFYDPASEDRVQVVQMT